MSKTKIVEKIVRFELFLTVIGQLCKSDQKIVRFELFLTVIGQLCKSDQNKIFPELNSKKLTPSPTV